MKRTELTDSDIFDLVNLVGLIDPETLTVECSGQPRDWTLSIIYKCRAELADAATRPKGKMHLLFPLEEDE